MTTKHVDIYSETLKKHLETLQKRHIPKEDNKTALIWKAICIIGGFGIFIWGIVSPEWIRMIGGILLMFFGALISSD